MKDKVARLHLLLDEEPQTRLPQIFEQFHQILAGTHVATKVQAPQVKEKTKGRPAHKKCASNSTKRAPSSHEIVEAQSQKEKIKLAAEEKKRKFTTSQSTSRKKMKQSDEDEGNSSSEEDEQDDDDVSMDLGVDDEDKDKNQDEDIKTNIAEGPSEGKKSEAFRVVSFPFSPSFLSK